MNRPYKWLARYYDQIFAPFRGPIDAARERVLGKILPAIGSACDLACGTGTTAVEMARGGIRMFAVDASPAMCRLAREKARSAGVPLRVLRADMRTFRLPEPVDLVICECDALNHVPLKADLRRVAKAVARALRPGGYFFFDVNNRSGFEAYWCTCFWTERPGVVLVMRNGNDARHGQAWSDIEWFIKEGSLWRRHHERVDEVCWTAGEIQHALRQAGFGGLHTWDGAQFFKNDPLMRAGCRTVYLARKEARR
ncbi:MAG: class I SAM-dependent methyltransferase [Bryobacteraceae bacterium]